MKQIVKKDSKFNEEELELLNLLAELITEIIIKDTTDDADDTVDKADQKQVLEGVQ
ncbi:MAG: hypothetical protein JWR38_2547 [Mucilaginibacter sp.]|nr:hypothetical protein [Mucilaginibacter sp.]